LNVEEPIVDDTFEGHLDAVVAEAAILGVTRPRTIHKP